MGWRTSVEQNRPVREATGRRMDGAEMFITEEVGKAEKWGQKNEFPANLSTPIFLPQGVRAD